ncbi:potassium channel family protein [Longispora sp. NPDC051575]|uniref:potassium channel family protein n=1 Tax=Longispora sp. NPDC051575 TaxID=3154943 RepID=UPI0034281F39
MRTLGSRYVLLGIIATYVLVILGPGENASAPVRVAILGALLAVTVRARRASQGWAGAALGLGVVLCAATVLVGLSGSERAHAVLAGSATTLLVAGMIVAVGQAALTSRAVDGATLRGVLSVYLLLALLFGAVHQVAGQFVDGYLHGVQGPPDLSTALYFSVITLTTIGYGDITPGCDVARAVAVTEALVGQLYLVSVVARVVSGYRTPDTSDPSRDEP